jgi:hypothetical protein
MLCKVGAEEPEALTKSIVLETAGAAVNESSFA